eukprot:Colp12_sorted_trinity150504_noHs@20728
MAKVLVLYYSTYGHIHKLAKAVEKGIVAAGATAVLKRVPETLSDEILGKMHALDSKKALDAEVPIISGPEELTEYDAIIIGTPTRFGNMAAQMKSFLDSTGGLWAKGALVGKVGGVFVSSATQHGGQESTILSTHTVLLHHGLIVVGLPYAFQGQMTQDYIAGCSPYGASTIAGGMGEKQPTEVDLAGAEFQGKHIASIATALQKGRA